MSDWSEETKQEEESSFISMADMMVGLLLIFIILLTYYVLTAQEAIEDANTASATENAAKVARALIIRQLDEQIDDEGVLFDQTTGTIRFEDNVLRFGSGQDQLPESSLGLLETVADELARTIPCLAHVDRQIAGPDSNNDCSWLFEAFLDQDLIDRNLGELEQYRGSPPAIWVDAVSIEGHTDCQRFPRFDDVDLGNWVLGSQRAARTYLFMTRSNPLLGQIFSKDPADPAVSIGAHRVLGVASYADRRPAREFGSNVYPEDPRLEPDFASACSALVQAESERPYEVTQNTRNRRIDIRIVMGWTAQLDDAP